jgi:ZIP family zinc transporter
MEWLSDFLKPHSPVMMALLATLFTWGVTAAGASFVFFVKEINQKVMDGMLGTAAGVMIAASFWSLLAPAIELAEEGFEWQTAAIGFMGGGLFLYIVDKILPHLHQGLATSEAEGIKTTWQRSVLLVMAITLHNIPEGLAVGVGFGALGMSPDLSNPQTLSLFGSAVALAFGIGLQNLPEGAAVSLPLRREGMGRWRAFLYGQGSGVVEPIAGVAGAWAVMSMAPVLPYALAFAAGAMIFVVTEELIPESQRHGNHDFATMGVMVGFTIMMCLDVGLG